MAKNANRIIIDTNLWIGFLLTQEFGKLDSIFINQPHTLLFSEEPIQEFLEVAHRPKFSKYFRPEVLQDLLSRISLVSEFVHVSSELSICRDPKDDFLLSLAKDGQATHLLTGDKDLLILGSYGATQIMTIAGYLDIM